MSDTCQGHSASVKTIFFRLICWSAILSLVLWASLARAATPSITAGNLHTCALTNAGAVQCWGYNYGGRLGNGTTTNSSTPVAVSGLASGVIAITAGGAHTCALTNAGAVKCWGSNFNGQLGNGTQTDSTTPVAVNGLTSGVVAITAGGSHTCAVTNTGAAWCWGMNYYGQVGNGTTTNSSIEGITSPVAVSGLTGGVVAIEGGGDHTCAVTNTGAAWCWGDNSFGVLGIGNNVDSSIPVTVSGLTSGVVAITGGRWHTCALTNAGAVKCWGNNTHGELGIGSTTPNQSYTPVTVSGLTSGVVTITAANWYTCALTNAGAVKCWGANQYGQLGDGTTNTKLTPTTVIGLPTGVVGVSAAQQHTCVITSTGTAWCWGDNMYGQLGIGSTTTQQSNTPVQVLSPGTQAADLALTMTATGDTQAGITYNGTVTNGGPSVATNTILTLPLPTGVTFTSATPAGCSTSGSTVTCALGNIAVGASVNFSINGAVTTPANYSTTASVTSTVMDQIPSNNSVSLTTTIGPPLADIILSISGTGTNDLGLRYFGSVSNAGPKVASNSRLILTLPTGATFGNATSGCSASSGTVTCVFGNLSSGGSVTFTINAVVTAPGNYSASAGATANITDPNTSNNNASLLTMVVVPYEVDAPTLPEWAAIIFTLGLMGIGVSKMRQRNTYREAL